MKTVLAVIGVLGILGILVVSIGGYWAYKKSGQKISEMSEKMTEDFIQNNKPSDKAVNALHRIENAAKLQDSFASMMLSSVAMRAMEDKKVDDAEIDLMNEGAELGEKGKIPKDKLNAYILKIGRVMPKQPAK